MEGKEVRFGIANSSLWATATTDASNGAVNSMHDSFTPLGGLVPLVNIVLGEIIFGGVGSGLYGMLIYRHPRRVHRRPDGRPHAGVPRQEDRGQEVKMAMLAILILPLSMLGFTALPRPCMPPRPSPRPTIRPARLLRDPLRLHLATGNNGSAFAGLTGNTLCYNMTRGLAMLIGRFLDHHPDAGDRRLAGRQEDRAASAGTFPTHGACSSACWSASS